MTKQFAAEVEFPNYQANAVKGFGHMDRLAQRLLIAALFTVSFDIFLAANIAGFTFRITFMFQGVFIILALLTVMNNERIALPLGFYSLLIWTLFILIFIWNSPLISRSLLYAFWLMFFVVMIVASVNLIRNEQMCIKVLRWYLISFGLIGGFGIFQFLLGAVGITPPLFRNAVIGGLGLPRIHAFSYEPSYFASYMLIGWVMTLAMLIRNRSGLQRIMPRRWMIAIFMCITVAIILSMARPVIAFMAIAALFYLGYLALKLIMGKATLFEAKSLVICFMAVIAGSLIFYDTIIPYADIFLGGTGMFGTATHSYDMRWQDLRDTLAVFAESPIIGHSLGGVAPAIAEMYGINATDNEIAKGYEGLMIFAEVLAASGIIGFIPFVLYIAKIIIKPLKLFREMPEGTMKECILALSLGLIAEIIILQYNQNILRAYLWAHIGLVSVFYGVITSSKRLKD
jgi:hypothetical protein